MKIARRKLEQLIKEEITHVLNENHEPGASEEAETLGIALSKNPKFQQEAEKAFSDPKVMELLKQLEQAGMNEGAYEDVADSHTLGAAVGNLPMVSKIGGVATGAGIAAGAAHDILLALGTTAPALFDAGTLLLGAGAPLVIGTALWYVYKSMTDESHLKPER
tara:strand:+ start:41 stop:529 length:489 start_codon:yes stop_codon:yes gene_type:complete